MDIPYVRAREERRYQERVLALLRIDADRDTDVTVEVGRGALVLEYPYDRLYWRHRLVWGDDLMTEARVRRNQSYVVVWHNQEIHSVPVRERGVLYVAVPSWWKLEFGASSLLCVLAPLVFTYHSADALHVSPRVRANLWAVAESQFVVFAFFAFLDAAYQGLLYSRTPDARAYGDGERGNCQVDDEPTQGRLVELP